jgi:hypothetical protein
VNNGQKESIDPFDVLISASMFHKATGILAQHGNDHSLAIPMMVYECMTVELYMKCLLRQRGVSEHTLKNLGHDLKKLFHALDDVDRQKIDKYLQNVVASHPDQKRITEIGVPVDLDSILDRTCDLFVKARYWFEGNAFSMDSSGLTSNLGLSFLAAALKELIFEVKPEWRENLSQVKIKFGRGG